MGCSCRRPSWRRPAPYPAGAARRRPGDGTNRVLVAYDSERLYLGIHAHYSDPALVRANRSDRDKTDEDDTVTVFIEPFLDNLRGYTFAVNGYGVQRDALVIMTTGKDDPAGDLSWNALYTSAGVLVEDGWTAEMAIPIRSLRYPSRGAGETHHWGFQVRRTSRAKTNSTSGRRCRGTCSRSSPRTAYWVA